MGRTLAIGDIHGGLKALIQVLERAAIQPEDTLIFLGDYVDGWSESPAVLDFLIALQSKYSCIFLKGNHDELLLHWLLSNQENIMWLQHGGASSVQAYSMVSESTKKQHITFLESLPPYYIDAKNRLFVHAGFTNLKGVHFEHFPKLLYWDRTLWEMALSLDPSITFESDYYPKRLKIYSEIFIGHTPVTQIQQTVPVQRASIWNLDTGAAFQGPLTILDIDSKIYWQSDPLPTLYPTEMGRN